MLESASLDIEAACVREAEGMAALFGSPVNRALINVFFLTDRNKKDTGVDRRDIQPLPIRSVGIIGAGIMGRGIAAANLKRNVAVSITDAAADALHQGVEKILEEASYNKQTKRADPERAVHYRLAADGHDERRRSGVGRFGDRSGRRKCRHQAANLRPARTAIARRGRAGLEHVDDSDHASWPKG